MVVADDEANVLRVYPRQGGAAVLEWDFSVEGPALPKELDVEASTVIGNLAFFLGSHGNSKDGGDAVAERGHMFAVEISGTGSDTRFSYVAYSRNWNSSWLPGIAATCTDRASTISASRARPPRAWRRNA